MNNLENIAMQIIINAGEAKSLAYEALNKANAGYYAEAEDLMKKANNSLNIAHGAQTTLLQKKLLVKM